MLRLWQFAIFALVFVGLSNVAIQYTQVHSSGTFGFTRQTTPGERALATVTSVTPGGPADRAGVRTGDVLSVTPSVHNLVALTNPIPGDELMVVDGGRERTMTAGVDTSPVPWALLIVFTVIKIVFLLMAALIAWRRPDDGAARALSVFLVCFGVALDFDTTVVPIDWVRLASMFVVQLLLIGGAMAFYTFACRFPHTATHGIRLMLQRAIWPAVIACVVSSVLSVWIALVEDRVPVAALASIRLAYLALYLLLVFGAIASLVVSYREATPDQKPRIRWVIGTFVVGFSGVVVIFLAYFVGRGDEVQVAAATTLAIPVGLAYVILRHRVIDTGFVINRAVVYTAVSVVIVGAFIVFEWLVTRVLEANSRASTIVELAGALALGLSGRYIHSRVDEYVDDLFFRDRHVAEAAIRRFAHETAMITDADVLIRRTVEVAERNARLMGAAFYGRLGSTFVPLYSSFVAMAPTIDENDEAVLDMRTWHQPVDVPQASIVPGYVSFPMIVRGQLAGFLACGEKTTHEAFAPDERDALRVLARDAGIALDSLRIARIEQELAYLSADGELPAELRMRLSSLLQHEDGPQPAGAAVRSIQ